MLTAPLTSLRASSRRSILAGASRSRGLISSTRSSSEKRSSSSSSSSSSTKNNHNKQWGGQQQQQQHQQHGLLATAAAGVAAMLYTSMNQTNKKTGMEKKKEMIDHLRTKSFPLVEHNHGKSKVRIMKVHRHDADDSDDDTDKDENPRHSISEYTVATKLFFDGYRRVFTDNDNTDLVATDTQRNTVYVVAKRTVADSPEQFAIDLCQHFLITYPMLEASEVEIDQVMWERVSRSHPHGFVKQSPETASCHVRLERGKKPVITSHIRKLTVLKTTMSGFEHYLQDEYTLLPPTAERCLATEMDATWTYTSASGGLAVVKDYNRVRKTVRDRLLLGIFGRPKDGGVYSWSLQATIYDAACLVLRDVPSVSTIAISTPNLHYIPFGQLSKLGETFEDDIFVPTSEPSGSIFCKVAREEK